MDLFSDTLETVLDSCIALDSTGRVVFGKTSSVDEHFDGHSLVVYESN